MTQIALLVDDDQPVRAYVWPFCAGKVLKWLRPQMEPMPFRSSSANKARWTF